MIDDGLGDYNYDQVIDHWVVFFTQIFVIDDWAIPCEIVLEWMSLNLTDNKSTWIQVMAQCRQVAIITWANVDPVTCRHMAPLDHNELKLVLLAIVSRNRWMSPGLANCFIEQEIYISNTVLLKIYTHGLCFVTVDDEFCPNAFGSQNVHTWSVLRNRW